MTEEATFPSWRYGPNGEAEIFQTEAEVPKGWKDAPFADAPTAFDHDGDGKPGGAVAPEPTDRLKELRDEYRALVGKKPFAGWGEAELETRIASAKAPEPEVVEIDTSEF
jgi:hypothetical protein